MIRKIFSICIMCFSFGMMSIKAQEGQILSLDLKTTLDIALSNNPSVKVADMEIKKKEYAKKSAIGSLLPQVDLIGQYQRAIKRQTVYFDGGFGMGISSVDPTKYTPEELKILEVLGKAMAPDPEQAQKGIQMGRLNSYTAGLNVSLPLVVPSLWKNVQMSKMDIELAKEQSRASRIDLVNKVTKAYYNALLAKDSYKVFKETYSMDSVNFENIQRKYKAGVVAEYDKISAEVRLKSIIPNILQAENMMKISELQLKILMGIDENMPIKLVGSLRDYEKNMFDEILAADSTMIGSTELAQFDLQNQKALKGLEIQKLQYYPTLTSTFNYMYMSQSNDFKFSDYRWDPYSTLGVTVSIPIFHGGKRYHDIKQTEIQLQQLKYQREDLRRNLQLGVRNNIEMINKNIEQIKATQSTIEQAKKGYSIAKKRYDTGLGTIVDVNAASLAVTNAELQYRNAIYDYLSAKSDLDKILGNTEEPISNITTNK